MTNNKIPDDWFTMELAGEDADLITALVNQGIDSRLEGFTRSTFEWHVHTIKGSAVPLQEWTANGGEKRYGHYFTSKLHCAIHPDEMQVLIRRMVEMEDSDDCPKCLPGWADAIVEMYYHVNMGFGIVEEAE